MANAIIERAANSESFRNNPVPPEILEEFTEDLLSFTKIPYFVKGNLEQLYPEGTDVFSALSQDWIEALEVGAIKLFDENTVSFALSLELVNGTPLEVSIRRNAHDDGRPWFMSYAPDPMRVRVRRGEQVPSVMPDANEPAVAPSSAPAAAAAPATAPASAPAAVTETAPGPAPVNEPAPASVSPASDAQYPDALPEPLFDSILAMKTTAQYLTSEIPEETAAIVNGYDGDFSSFVWIPARWRETLRELSGLNMNVVEFLNREWRFAHENDCVRYYDGKMIFPVSILREDGITPVEISIKRDNRLLEQPSNGTLPWFVTYVESFIRTTTNANKALREWAWLGDIHAFLDSLATIALPERWDFDESADEVPRYSILRNYINYTFFHLQAEGKILIDENEGIAAFNTGLVDQTYEAIYACFSHSNQGLEWRFESFCKAGSRGWGKRLVSTFNPLPARANYITRKEDLLFDTDSPLTPDTDHILLDNINRLPREFLEEELMSDADALELVERAFEEERVEDREIAFDTLSDMIENNIKIRRRLKNRLNDAIDLACKRAEWNFKTAVPAWYPSRDIMSLLLPLDLTEDNLPDVALVVELTESGAYIGQTILTMPMAYMNARLICRPDSDWLNTSLKFIEGEEDND